ncbi:YheC/YheD family endospore coat-associated protein [Brevibacillus migulae]|uniref:YheC/YheD family endospore coat-associated protein n=1 Tax=Brevibacillus migulae TaxID=1644114 RepID=UPI00106E561E|nr:YheC/YheD family protein [Brevibacillus migulae]
MNKVRIGILTSRVGSRFSEPRYFRQLIHEGARLGCQVFLFAPQDVDVGSRSIYGYVPAGAKGWIRRKITWPDVVIDRYRYSPTAAFQRYVAFRRRKLFPYTNNRLANKWKVHQVLIKDERMHPWLPDTQLFQKATLRSMLRKHSQLYVKPVNGTGGRGILKIERTEEGYHLLGRDHNRVKRSIRTNSQPSLLTKVERWVNRGYYIIQQGLALDLKPGRSVDMRLLLQKNQDGVWSITGHGIRVGGQQSATSNLHGGGTAVDSTRFLAARFNEERAKEIVAECEKLGYQTAATIENHFGRMLELGLDIGVDRDGRVWLIEVNPKPGREIFKELGQLALYRQAIRKPLQYAMHVASTE